MTHSHLHSLVVSDLLPQRIDPLDLLLQLSLDLGLALLRQGRCGALPGLPGLDAFL